MRELLGEPLLGDEARDAIRPPAETTTLIRVTSAPLGLEPADVEIDIDIEYDEQQRVYLWGFLVSHPANPADEPRYVHVGSSDPDLDPSAIATMFLEKVQDVINTADDAGKSVRVYHYGVVEQLYMERLLGAAASPVLERATDLLPLIREHFFSAAGYGLKKVARLAGATWRTEGLDGSTAHEWLAKARAGDDAAWSALVDYNEDDVRANRAVRELLRTAL